MPVVLLSLRSLLCVFILLYFYDMFLTRPCTDGLAIYLLNLLLAFLQPKFDPSLQDDLLADEIEEGGEQNAPVLPSQRDDEFRPFVRRLPEWQFWCELLFPFCFAQHTHHFYRLSSTRATLVSLFCTTSEVFDVPVYWPILVVYFCVLFALTMRRQIQCVHTPVPIPCVVLTAFIRHMIKYKYIPFDIGRKARYGGNK